MIRSVAIRRDGKVQSEAEVKRLFAKLLMHGSGTDSCPLAFLCQSCLEKHEVRFA